jgi:hypothetical protein
MTDAIKGSGQVQSFKLADLGMKKEAEKLIEKETVQTEDGQVEAHVFDNEEDALKYASRDSGDEAVIKLADGRYAVVDIKSTYAEVSKLDASVTQKDQFGQLKVKAESLFEPDKVQFPERVLSRSLVYQSPDSQYRETGMDRLELLPGADAGKSAEHNLKLAKMALEGKVGGFNTSLATNSVKGDMIATNLATVAENLLKSIDSLKNQPDKAAQVEELKTYLTILQAKLLIMPQSNQKVPGMDLNIGAYRNPQDNDKAETLVRQRLGELQKQYGQETDETRKTALKGQIDTLGKAASVMDQTSLQIQQAALAIQVRLGALATINNTLVDAQASLKKDIADLNALYQELHLDPKAATYVGNADARILALETKINQDRQKLIKAMEDELKTFKNNAPKVNGQYQSGAAETISLLEKQIQKLRDLKPMEGKNYAPVCEELLQTVNDTQASFTTQLEQASLDKINKAGKIWEGISPDEAKQVTDIVTNTNKYTQGYDEAKKALSDVQDKQEIAHKVMEFEQGLYSLDENPEMTDAIVDVAVRTNDGPLKAQMLSALSSSPISDGQQMEAFGAKYQELITKAIKEAKEGTKLYELQQCYSAMALSKSPDWKDRVDVAKLQEKITALSQEPEIQTAFDAAKAEAIQTILGDQATMAAKVENYILSDDFQRRLKLSSPDEQKTLIQSELRKLTLLAPDRVMDVSKKLMMKNFEAHGADAYLELKPGEGASAFESFVKSSKKFSKFTNGVGQFSKIMDKALREVAMSPGEKTPDAVIKALQRLKASNPSAAQAIDFMTEWKSSGKLGSLDGLFAGVALISKGIPHDTVSALDSSTSLFSLLSKGEDFAKLFGMTDDALKIGKLGKTLHFMKWLGPAADFIGAGLDFYKMADEIKHGDTWGAVGKGVSGVGGVAAGVGGVMILAGCTGPAAPIVLVGGIVVGLVGWGIDAGAGESPEETLLREVGVLKPAPPKEPTQYEKRQESPYYMNPGKI